MTKLFFPYDAGQGANVIESQWRKMAQLWLATGVIKGHLDELEVFADGSAREVYVRAGKAWSQGHYFEDDEQDALVIGANGSVNPRIDRVVLRNDFVANMIDFAVLLGTPAADPQPPALTQDSNVHEAPLAKVRVEAGASVIAADKVTDERFMVFVPASDRVPLQIFPKKSDQTLQQSNINLQNVTDLALVADANRVYDIEVVLHLNNSGSLAGFRFGWTVPAGASLRWLEESDAGTPSSGNYGARTVATLGEGDVRTTVKTGSSAVDLIFVIRGRLVMGSTAGTVQLRAAQSVSTAANCIIRRASRLSVIQA